MAHNPKVTVGIAVAVIALGIGVLGWQWKKSNASERPMMPLSGGAAQGEGGGAGSDGIPNPKTMREQMAKDLGLSSEQQEKMQASQTGMQEKMKALFDNKKMPPEEKMKQMQSMMQTMQKHIATILTPEQQQKMQDTMAKRMGGMPGGGIPRMMGRGGGMGMPPMMGGNAPTR